MTKNDEYYDVKRPAYRGTVHIIDGHNFSHDQHQLPLFVDWPRYSTQRVTIMMYRVVQPDETIRIMVPGDERADNNCGTLMRVRVLAVETNYVGNRRTSPELGVADGHEPSFFILALKVP